MSKSHVIMKTFTYWPDGSWKEAPNDGFVFHSPGAIDTYTWDGMLEVWVSGCGGKIIDFAPAGKPSKVYELDDSAPKSARTVPKCECGAEKIGSPGHSHWCPISSRL
jgi:sugar lactone lactonase YvrE